MVTLNDELTLSVWPERGIPFRHLGDYFSLGNLTSGMVVNVSLQMPSTSDLLPETYLMGPDGREIAFSDNQVLSLGGTSADYGIVNTFSNFPTTTFTAEFWMRSTDASKYGTPISYARDGQINEMMLYDYRRRGQPVHCVKTN